MSQPSLLDPRLWGEAFRSYGPVVLVTFFVYVIEKRVRVLMPSLKPKWVATTLYVSCWVGIFGLSAIAVYAWMKQNVATTEWTIQGEFRGLGPFQEIVSDNENLFLRRRYGRGGGGDYQWRLISEHQLAPGTTVAFDLVSGPKEPRRYRFAIDKSFYQQLVVVEYRAENGLMRVVLKDKTEDIEGAEQLGPEQASFESQAESSQWGLLRTLMPVVHAQAGEVDLPTILYGLEARDPALRRTARASLAARGPQAIPGIEEILLGGAPYQRVLGAVVALSLMDPKNSKTLGSTAHAALRKLALGDDPLLRHEAVKLLVADPRELPHGVGRVSVPGLTAGNATVRIPVPGGQFALDFSHTPEPPGQIRLDLTNFGQSAGLGGPAWAFVVRVDGQFDRTVEPSRPVESGERRPVDSTTHPTVRGPQAELEVAVVGVIG